MKIMYSTKYSFDEFREERFVFSDKYNNLLLVESAKLIDRANKKVTHYHKVDGQPIIETFDLNFVVEKKHKA